jgi:DNA-binding transcriptional ArsR family regulator
MDEMHAIAHIAQALADETRLRLLMILQAGDATVTDLAARLDLAQPRVSTHLALLREAGLVTVQRAGRQRTYHVDAMRIGNLLAALGGEMTATSDRPTISAQAARAVRRDLPIRQARTCYDHLAGVAGVHLLDTLLERGWLVPRTVVDDREHILYDLTPAGEAALRARNVDVDAARQARRRFAFGCLDWTERRPHLGGALGVAILHALEASGNIHRDTAARTVEVRAAFDAWLGGREGYRSTAGEM